MRDADYRTGSDGIPLDYKFSNFTHHSKGQSKARFNELDGILGWTSLSVVAYHMTWETFRVVLPEFP
jgi:hypothetical protein